MSQGMSRAVREDDAPLIAVRLLNIKSSGDLAQVLYREHKRSHMTGQSH